MAEIFNIIPNPVGIYNIIGHSGYDLYTACDEHIDNPFALNVKASFSRIAVETDSDKKISVLFFADDGVSMSKKGIERYFTVGNSDGNPSNLGNYGAGGKSASYSLARRLTVFTKQNGVWRKYEQDLDDIEQTNSYVVKEYDDSEILTTDIMYCEDLINHNISGTVIKVDKLYDTYRIGKQSFKETMVKHAQIVYSKYMTLHNKDIYVVDKKVEPIDYFGGYNEKIGHFRADFLGSGKIYLDGYEEFPISWEAYHKPRSVDKSMEDYFIKPNSRNAGLTLFRNDRLVALGLKGAIFTGLDRYLDGLAVAVSFDGHLDKHFGGTFNKIIKTADFSDELTEKLKAALAPVIRESEKRRKEESECAKSEDEKNREQNISKIIEKLLIGAHKARIKREKKFNDGKQHPTDKDNQDEEKEKIDREKIKKRVLSVFGGFSISKQYSPKDPLYDLRLDNGRYSIIMNGNHPAYEAIFDGANEKGVALFAVSEVAFPLSIDCVENPRERNKRRDFYDEAKETRDDYLGSLFAILKNPYEDDEYSIEDSDNCVGVGMTSDDFGITNVQKDELEIAIAAS